MGKPRQIIELIERRTRNAKHYLNNDGTFTAVIGHDLHYPGPSGWEDIDLNYRASGTEFVVDKHYLKYRLYRRSAASRLVVTEQGSNKGIEFTLPGAPVPSGRKLRFDRDGLSWEYATRKSGLKLSATASVRQGPKTYSFVYALQNGAAPLSVDPDGNLFSDVFTMPRAYALGADKKVYPCGMWKVSANTISFDWDDSTLPDAAFPYELDPTTTFTITSSSNDSSAENNATVYPPNTTPALTPSQTFLVLGRTFGTDSKYYVGVGLMRFDTASIPDTSTVDAATLRGFVEIKEAVNSLSVVMDYFAWNGTTADWTNSAPSNAHAGTPIANIAGAADRDFALQNLSNINKSGITSIRATITQRSGDAAPTGGNYAIISSWDHTTNAEPRLIVTYSDTTPPAARTDLTANPGNNRAYLDWGDNTETDFSHYNLYRGTAAGGPYTKVNTANITASAFTDTGVTNGTKYFYVVRGVDTTGNESGNSNEANVTPIATPPAAPTGLTSTAKSTTRIDSAWSANAETDLAGYNIYRSLNADGSAATKLNGALITTTSFSDTGLTINTNYYYYVTAVDTESAESARSSIVYEKTFNIVRTRPDATIAQTNLTGAITDIQDDPDAPDALWWTAAAPSGSVGLQSASAHAASSGIANQLTNPGNALGTDEATQATVVGGTVNADYSNFFSFGSIFGGIPDNAIITGVTVQTREWASNANRSSSFVRLDSANGTAISAELGGEVTTAIPAAGQPKNTYTAWNVLPTVAQLKASGFGVRLRFVRTATQVADYSLDWLRISVSWQLPSSVTSTLARVSMENPANLLVLGAGLQELRVQIRKAGNGANPTVRIEVRETDGTTALATPVADTAISATGVVAGTWDAAILAERFGQQVEIVVVGTGTQGASVEVGAIEWNATVSKEPSAIVLSGTGIPSTSNISISSIARIILGLDGLGIASHQHIALFNSSLSSDNSALSGGGISSAEIVGEGALGLQLLGIGITVSSSIAGEGSVDIVATPLSGGGDILSNNVGGTGSLSWITHFLDSTQVITTSEAISISVLTYGEEPPRVILRSAARLLRGQYGVPFHNYELWHINSLGEKLARIKSVTDGATVRLSNYSDATWSINLQLHSTDSFDPLVDRLMVTDTVSTPEYSEQFSLGVYMFDTPAMEHWENHSVWSLSGNSMEMVLLQDMPVSYTVGVGTNILEEVKRIIIQQGFPASRIDFPNITKKLRNAFTVNVTEASDAGWWLRICNALLNAGGFYALSTTGEGRFYTSLATDLTQRPPDIVYGPKGDGMLVPPIEDTYESDRFANRIIVVSQDAQDTPPLVAIAENHNPESAASYQRMGNRFIMKPPITLNTIASQEDLQRVANIELQKASSYLRKGTITTFPDPRCGPQQIYGIAGVVQSKNGEPFSGIWNVIGWEQPISIPRSPMKHTISRIEAI